MRWSWNMQAAEKLALRDPPPLSASPTKKPSGWTSYDAGPIARDPCAERSSARTRTGLVDVTGAAEAPVAARVWLSSRFSTATWGELSWRLTNVQPPAAATTTQIAATAPTSLRLLPMGRILRVRVGRSKWT